MNTPELDKRSAILPLANTCGEFWDWLREKKNVEFVTWVDITNDEALAIGDDPPLRGNRKKGYQAQIPFSPDMETLLAEFFGIDLEKIEEERRALLDAMRPPS